MCCSATLTASGVQHGDLLVLTRPQEAGLDRSDNPMAVMQDGTPGNPAVRPELPSENENFPYFTKMTAM